MSLGSDAQALLLGSSGVTALVGAGPSARIKFNVLPQPPTFPAVVLTVVDNVALSRIEGPAPLFLGRLQCDCYATSYADAHALADAVRVALDGFAGMMTVTFLSERDLFEGDTERPVFRVLAEFRVGRRA